MRAWLLTIIVCAAMVFSGWTLGLWHGLQFWREVCDGPGAMVWRGKTYTCQPLQQRTATKAQT